MTYQELGLGRDLDEMAMSTDQRTLLQQIKSFLIEKFGIKEEVDLMERENTSDQPSRI